MIKKIIQRMFDFHPKVMSFMPGMKLTGLPIITFSQGENDLNLILDTGTDLSIIDRSCLAYLDHSFIYNEEGEQLGQKNYGVDGKWSLDPVCDLTLECDGKQFSDTFVAKDMTLPFENMKNGKGVTLHGILGTKFFNKYKYVLDFDKLIAYSKE